ncbi:hypothetical protein HCG49_11245 [Arenibacter sp. 6A1]|uniref:hypothetical protein n=1 Tax=Arenibacter sp. 6A1 TaxID=2720391 RepID=UPI00144636E2|nr:hypothetical protein [Arenibacter sp. 6A1]NKI27138.1 hypothetical protein [Arenibacter sp. 6A1]
MTKQISDTLLYEGSVYFLNDDLLEKYFIEFPDKMPDFEVISSDLWKGYSAEYKIKEGQLFINKLKVLAREAYRMRSVLKEVFPNDTKMEWFSGLIRIDDFKGEFALEPEEAIFEYLEIYKGNYVQKRIFDFSQLQDFKKAQFEHLIASDEMPSMYELWHKIHAADKYYKEMDLKAINQDIADNILYYSEKVYV